MPQDDCPPQGINAFDHDIAYSYVSCSAYCYATVTGWDLSTWEYGLYSLDCVAGGEILIEWATGDLLIDDGGCQTTTSGDPTDFGWSSSGYGEENVKFVHADNLVDTLVHTVL